MEKLIKTLVYNWHYKLLAFSFALLIWFVATNKETAQEEITIKLLPQPTGNYKILDYSPKKIILTVEGYRSGILSLKESGQVRYKLPSKLKLIKNKALVELKKENFLLPPSIRIKSVFPNTVEVKIEKLIAKAVPVKLKAYGIPFKAKINLDPNYVVVMTPKEEKVKFVETQKVDLSGIKGKSIIYLKLNTKQKVEPNLVKVTIIPRR